MARDWRTRRISRRYVYLLGVLAVLLPLVMASQAAADHLTLDNPPSFSYVLDEDCRNPTSGVCPDDQPGQKDLSSHAVANPAPGDLWVSWNWDVTGLSGGNTGDACALFDTDSNFKVDYALCLTISGSPAAESNTRVYSCGDAKADRCTSQVVQVADIHSICDVTQPANSDPFHSGEADTVAVCHVALEDVGGAGTAILVNTCSYPSEQPNSDPSDCVLIPRDAFIKIVKDATPNAGTFSFQVDGSGAGIVFPTTQSNVATGDETSDFIAITSGTPSHSVSETVPSGWDLTSASCTGASGSGTSNGTFNSATGTISGIIAGEDQTVTCTFNNRQRASIDISKTGSDAGAQTGAVFTLYTGFGTAQQAVVGTCTVDANGNCGPNDPSFSNLIPDVQYTIDETTVPAGYTKPASLPQNVTLTAGQPFTVSYVDQAQLFKAIVIVCRQSDSTLYPSGITIDSASAGNSLSAAQATTAGLSESALCGLAAGAKSNLRSAPHASNPHSASIDIPSS